MSNETLLAKNLIEAALMAAGEPLSLEKLSLLFQDEEHSPQTAKEIIKEQIISLQHDYSQKGLELVELASGYAIRVRPEYANSIAILWEEKPQKHTRAFLETLALIAYRQPITRAEIEKIRGVAVSSHIIKILLERQWIKIVGYRDLPGKPGLYATTKTFLDYFSLKSLNELPPLDEILDLDKAAHQLELALKGEMTSEDKKSTALEMTPKNDAENKIIFNNDTVNTDDNLMLQNEILPESEMHSKKEILSEKNINLEPEYLE